MNRRRVLFSLGSALSFVPMIPSQEATSSCSSADHVEWAAETLGEMLTMKPGLTRADVLKLFTTEGGLVSSGLKRTYVSRKCPYFKIDVEFRPVNSTADSKQWPESLDGNPTDVVSKVSRPYLEFSIAD